MEPRFAEAREQFLSGIAAFEAGQLQAAEQHFESSLRLLPGRVSTLTNLAATRMGLGRFAEALEAAQQALEAEPDLVEALWQKAVALSELQRLEEALAALTQVLQRDAAHAGAVRQRVMLLTELQRDDQALVASDAWLRLQPDDAEAWLRHGQAQLRLGRFDAALPALEQAVVLAPADALAWSALGELHKSLGRREDAIAAFQRALVSGGNAELLNFHLAALTSQSAPTVAPARYVQMLFNGYAESFDAHLVETLGYQAPQILLREWRELVQGQSAVRVAQALDLGCGTGLCGPLLATVADAVDGVDLASRMLDKARARGIYRQLVESDVALYLQTTAVRYDLVVAADVFIYIGDLTPVFEGATAALRHGGTFSFSVECADDSRDFVLLPSMRYAHSQAYLQRLALRHGFEVLRLARHPLRSEQSGEIPGLYAHLRKV